MTTSITVSVPETAEWVVVVTEEQKDVNDLVLSATNTILEAGEEKVFHAHDGMNISVREIALSKYVET